MLDLAAIDHLDQVLPGREMAIEGPDADPGLARDILQRRPGPVLGEGRGGSLDQLVAVPAGVGAQVVLKRSAAWPPAGRPDFAFFFTAKTNLAQNSERKSESGG
jgi:hypothetical protein